MVIVRVEYLDWD